MRSEDGDFTLVYNGEFYNHKAFREKLYARGYRFRGTSDTETLLYLLQEWGTTALEGVAGIFALAFWDRKHRRLILARDPLGVKQIYYHDNGKRLLFASEIKALLLSEDISREIDADGINQYLHFHTPLFEKTFFKGIRQARPGEFIEVNGAGPRPRIYWQTDGFAPRSEGPEHLVKELEDLLEEIIAEQLMADVPVGAFFSGGIDSSSVASFAKKREKSLHCFGVHFEDQGTVDEGPYQKSAAATLGLSLDLITINDGSFPGDMLKLMYFQDEPVIGAAMIPMYYVSQLASEKVKVCLGGQGADEIFAGYARYALARPFDVIGSWFSGRHLVDPGSRAHENKRVGGSLLKQVATYGNVSRLFQGIPHMVNWKRWYFNTFAKVPERNWLNVLGERGLVNRKAAWAMFSDGVDYSPAKDPGDKLLHWDVQTYLPGLFHQDDRMSMANSLESRVPLADPRVVRFAMHIPFDLKLRSGSTKWILRQAVAGAIPMEVLNRRKVGFDTPVERWIRGPHKDFVRELLLSSTARNRGLWNTAGLEKVLNDGTHSHWFDIVWKAISIESWARTFLDQKVPAPVTA
jgi:asparagine synthase (glutamine-hydrolysing)